MDSGDWQPMGTLNKLLVVIEPELDEQPALDKALPVARQAGAELELVICDHSAHLDDGRYFDFDRAAELRREHIERNRQHLESMAEPVRAEGIRVRVDSLWGHPPYEKIIDKVLDSSPDLVVQYTQPHTRLGRLLLSHQDWQLLRYCPCPLLLVHERTWNQSPTFVAAVDPVHEHDKRGELDDRLVRAGQELASVCDGRLALFHCCYQPPVSGIYPVAMHPEDCRNEVADLMQRHGLADEQLHVSDQDIRQSLPGVVEDIGGDVVLMGVTSRSKLDRLLVGNTAERILDRMAQDVLVFKPEGFTDTVKRARQANHAL